jgi:hypothetical protein
MECGLISFGSREGPAAFSREHGNEVLSSMKGGKFLD